MNSIHSFKVKVRINDIVLNATIDTGATVSVLCSKLLHKFDPLPKIIKTKMLNCAGVDQTVKADVIGPVKIVVGHLLLFKPIFCGPIHDEFLLGLDLLLELRGKIDIGRGTFYCQDHPVPIKKIKVKKDNINYATLCNFVLIRPFSVVESKIKFEPLEEDQCFFLEPNYDLPVHIANQIYKSNSESVCCMYNNSKKVFTLDKGTVIGTIVPLPQPEILEQKNIIPLNSVDFDIPEHVAPLLEKLHSSLNGNEKEKVASILKEYADIFAKSEYDIGHFTGLSHKIEVTDTLPVKLNRRRTPFHLQDIQNEMIEKLLDAKIIQPSTSSYASCPTMTKKKGGKYRFCIDFRLLNRKTIPDVFPLPLLSECIQNLEGNCWFSKLDCNNAYHQIPVHPESKDKTAFRCSMGLFEYNYMPFGLTNAVSTYSRAIDLVLKNIGPGKVIAFLDDICVLGKDFESMIQNLKEVFERFRQHGMRFKPSKCQLFVRSMTFLGRQIRPDGVTITDHAIETIKRWKEPVSVKEIESFLGFANFHRNFIKGYSFISEPLVRLLRKPRKFVWEQEQKNAFRKLCDALISPAVLTLQRKTGRLFLEVDSSTYAIGGELLQLIDGVKRPISYGSFSLTRAQMKYCTTRLELLAVVRFCVHFKAALLATEFTVVTDHFALKWLFNFRQHEGQLARWLEILSQFNFVVEHRPGRLHQNADALSRRPNPEPCEKTGDPYSLPCGGCKYCLKVHKRWQEFNDLIDDNVINLADNNNLNKILEPEEILASTGNICRVDINLNPIGDENDNVDLTGFDPDEIIKHQQGDPNFAFLIDFLENKVEPTDQELKMSHPAKQFYFLNRNLFTIINGIIYQTSGVDKELLLVPNSLKNDVLYICHDIPTAGHFGIEKTKIRVKQKYTWFQKSKDISSYVLSCPTCALSKSANRPGRHPRVIDHAGFPLQKVHMDHLGPLTVTHNKNAYVLVIVDNFTKWVECIPLENLTAVDTARAAVSHFFCRFGFPIQLVTDQGSTFESQLFKEMCRMFKIRKSRTTPYRPSANGQAEIRNRQLMAAVRCYVSKHKKDWDIYVPLVAGAIRSAVNRHTGYTPNELMLGRQINTPSDIAFPDPRSNIKSLDEHITNLRNSLELAHNTAREYLKTQLKITKKNNDTNPRLYSYKVADIIYVLDRSKKTKLSPLWLGPGIVTKVYSPQTVQIQLKNDIFKVVSHDYLKISRDKVIPGWIQKTRKSILENQPRRHCICDMPNDGQPMVQCSGCQEWFHLVCLNLTELQAQRMESYICINCNN